MGEQVKATYQGQKLADFVFHRSWGIKADRFNVVMSGQGNIQIIPAGGQVRTLAPNIEENINLLTHGDLVLTDSDGQTQTIQGVYIDDSVQDKLRTFRLGTPQKILLREFALTDVRWLWENQGYVTGNYNIIATNEDKPFRKPSLVFTDDYFFTESLKYIRKNEYMPWTLGELIEKCFANLPADPTSGATIPFVYAAALPVIYPQNIKWGNGINAARALQSLLDTYKLVLSLNLDNTAVIHEKGQGIDYETQYTDKISEKQKGKAYKKTPTAFDVIGKPTRIEMQIASWNYVMTNDDGKIEAQEKVIADWGLSPKYIEDQAFAIQVDKKFDINQLMDGITSNSATSGMPEEDQWALAQKRQGILRKEAWKHLELQKPYQLLLPLLPLWYQKFATTFPAQQPGDFRLAGLFHLKIATQAKPKGFWVYRWYDDAPKNLYSLDAKFGRIILTYPAGGTLPLVRSKPVKNDPTTANYLRTGRTAQTLTEYSQHDIETHEVRNMKTQILDLKNKILTARAAVRQTATHRDATEKILLKDWDDLDAAGQTITILTPSNAVRILKREMDKLRARYNKFHVSMHNAIQEHVKKINVMQKELRKLQPELDAMLKENAEQLESFTMTPILMCSVELPNTLYRFHYGLDNVPAKLVKSNTIQEYISLPDNTTTPLGAQRVGGRGTNIRSNIDSCDGAAERLIQTILQAQEKFEVDTDKPTLSGFQYINTDGKINQVTFKIVGENPVTQLLIHMPKGTTYATARAKRYITLAESP